MSVGILHESWTKHLLCRSIALTSGDLLLFQWILQQFDQDLQCRLEVFAGRPGKNLMTKRQALLQNSQLWREFLVSNSSSSSQSHCLLNTISDSYLAEETVRTCWVGHQVCKVQCPMQYVQITVCMELRYLVPWRLSSWHRLSMQSLPASHWGQFLKSTKQKVLVILTNSDSYLHFLPELSKLETLLKLDEILAVLQWIVSKSHCFQAITGHLTQ